MLRLKQLHYLVVLAQTQHFGRAAELCYVSQPTLSGQIKKLEQQLGARLLESSKPKLLLTPLGHQVVQRAQALITQVRDIELLAGQSIDPLQGKLRLAIIPSLAAYILPVISQVVVQQLPALQVELVELQTHQLIAQLQTGLIDGGLLALPKDTPGLRSVELWVEHFVLAVPATHEWAQRTRIASQDIHDQNLLLLEDGHCLAEQSRRLCGLSDTYNAFKGTSLETLRHMVRMGYGVTLVPQLTQQLWQQQGEQGIKFLSITDPAPGRQLGFLGRQGSAIWPLIKRLNDIAQSVLPYQQQGANVIAFD